jgi:hypothetical protein
VLLGATKKVDSVHLNRNPTRWHEIQRTSRRQFPLKSQRAEPSSRCARLQALGADFSDVVMINSFHIWSAPEFNGDRMGLFAAFREVKAKFMPAPHPAWTAVGTSGLIRDLGIVEVQVIAYAPKRNAANSSAAEAPSSTENRNGAQGSAFRRPFAPQ